MISRISKCILFFDASSVPVIIDPVIFTWGGEEGYIPINYQLVNFTGTRNSNYSLVKLCYPLLNFRRCTIIYLVKFYQERGGGIKYYGGQYLMHFTADFFFFTSGLRTSHFGNFV